MSGAGEDLRTVEIDLEGNSATEALGAKLAGLVRPGVTIALIGDLGAGKTTLTRGFAQALGVEGSCVSSPTYVLHHIYPTRDGWPIHHFDIYRLEDSEQFESLGVGEIFDSGGVCLVEWADKAMDSLPAHSWVIELRHIRNGEARQARMTIPARIAERLTVRTHGFP